MSGETSRLSSGGKDSVAGDDKGDWVFAESASNGSGGIGLTYGDGKFGVSGSSSWGDIAGGLANPLHERTCPFQVHRDVSKVLNFALKVP